jgi:hypothetical protein
MATLEGSPGWHSLLFSEHELDLDITLSCGQIFSWHRASDTDSEGITWRGVLADT